MREHEFREWLERTVSLGTASSQLRKVRKLDRYFGDLDAHIANGTIDTVAAAVDDPENSPLELGNGDRKHLATSLRYYLRFIGQDGGGESDTTLDHTPIWFVTARWGEEDGTDRFVSRGEWSLLRDSGSPANRRVCEMHPGDRIVLRHKYQQTRDLPFDANGKSVSVMKIKAIGTITEHREDGVSVGVDWQALAEPRFWYFYNHTEAVWRLRDPGENETADRLRRFILDGEPQDYAWFLNNPFWRDRLFGVPADIPLTDAQILARFDRSILFRDGRTGWTPEQTVAFCAIARAVHEAGLDWWFVDMARGPVRFGRKSPGRVHAEGVVGYLSVAPPWVSFNDRGLDGLDMEDFAIEPAGAELLADGMADKAELIASWKAPQPSRAGLWPDEGVREEDGSDREMTDMPDMPDPTNLILYGPPGTGKTYRTAREAVRLCDGMVSYREDAAGRAALMVRYHELVAARRIDFVTFHQNFAYEEFVEGLRPDLGGGAEAVAGGFRLKAAPGIFSAIADRAATPVSTDADRITLDGRRIFKLSLGQSNDPHSAWVFEESLAEGYALFGFRDVDWSDPRFANRDAILQELLASFPDERITAQMGDVKSPDRFRNDLAEGDVVVVTKGLNAFRAIGLVEGPYEYAPREHGKYSHRRRIRWLWHDPEGLPYQEISPDTRFSLETIYELPRTRLNLPTLQRLIDSGQAEDAGGGEVLQHVLVIDEINRANISKVFGELITLIEPDKRLGMDNALTVRLPYSRREFGVPANLHIVGTMNTADRSIALLDTALRRRFRFEELAPRPDLLEEVEGVPLGRVLDTINRRLEYLLDRDHAIGHAFFMGEGGASRPAIDDTMRFKVIPLLQEYFFEDWGRIHAVLGDGFITGTKLTPPPGFEDDRERRSWSVRRDFLPNAYAALLAGKPSRQDPLSDEEDEGVEA